MSQFFNRKVQYLLSCVILILVVGHMFGLAQNGIDMTDEGMYLSASLRYALGDSPYRDEVMNATRPFDLLLSPLFRAFPDISLLEVRTLGLGLRALSLGVLFLFLSRFAPPLLIALACAAGFIFIQPLNTASPSYNSVSCEAMIVAGALWMWALDSASRFKRISLATGGGFFFAVGAFSYLPLAAMAFFPTFMAGWSYFRRETRDAKVCLLLVTVFLALFAAAFATIISYVGIADFTDGFTLTMQGQSEISGGLWNRPLEWARSLFVFAPVDLLLLTGLCLAAFATLSPEKRKDARWTYGLSSLLFMGGGIAYIVRQSFNVYQLGSFFFTYSMLLALSAIAWSLYRRLKTGRLERPEYIFILGIAGFLLPLSLLYGLASTAGAWRSVLVSGPMLAVGGTLFYVRMKRLSLESDFGKGRNLVWVGASLIVPLFFAIMAMVVSTGSMYRDAPVSQLTATFQHSKLRGIHSTPEKVSALEALLDYLDGKIKPNDRFLAYNNIPLLYFLTNTRPAYRAVWARDDWPLSFRQDMVHRMIDRKRQPEYAVRMLATPRGEQWRNSLFYPDDSPLDKYVTSNYYLEKIIYPFQVWRRGPGPKYRVIKEMKPLFQAPSIEWRGPAVIDASQAPTVCPPLRILSLRGRFTIEQMASDQGSFVRIKLVSAPKGKTSKIVIGYELDLSQTGPPAIEGKQIIMLLSARLALQIRRGYEPFMIMGDKADHWDMNNLAFSGASWNEYAISKRIRQGATKIFCGLYWSPESTNQWVDMGAVGVYPDNDL